MAILLENILMRVDHLEKVVMALNSSHGYLHNQSLINAEQKVIRSIIENVQDKSKQATESQKVKDQQVIKKLTAEGELSLVTFVH